MEQYDQSFEIIFAVSHERMLPLLLGYPVGTSVGKPSFEAWTTQHPRDQ
jgi:hypothetical protein